MEAFRVPDESDDGLMERAQRNDPSAFAALYDRHAAPAFAVAQSVCRDSGLAEEAVQEGFLSIWRGRDGYRPREGASFRGWAMEIVRNRAIDSHRRRGAAKRPRTFGEPSFELADSSSTLELVIERDRSEHLSNVLARLPEAQAEVIALAFFGELTHTEISEQLGLPAGTVKGRMRLGMEKLRRGMDRPSPGGQGRRNTSA